MILILLILKKKKNISADIKFKPVILNFFLFFFFKYVLIQKYIIRTGKEIIRFNEKICN